MQVQNLLSRVDTLVSSEQNQDRILELFLDKLLLTPESISAELSELIKTYKDRLRNYVDSQIKLHRVKKWNRGSYHKIEELGNWWSKKTEPFYQSVTNNRNSKNQVKNQLIKMFNLSNFDIKEINRGNQ